MAIVDAHQPCSAIIMEGKGVWPTQPKRKKKEIEGKDIVGFWLMMVLVGVPSGE
jgi:hypothetical protein